jgi:hypothetical protein
VEEQALERDGTATSGRFRYIVWNYTTPKERPVAYGVGEFRTVQIASAHTRITWTYSFKLKDDVFPGYLGALGRWLFRVGFLDRDYAAMMRGVLDGYKTTAEAHPNDAQHASKAGVAPDDRESASAEAQRGSICPYCGRAKAT